MLSPLAQGSPSGGTEHFLRQSLLSGLPTVGGLLRELWPACCVASFLIFFGFGWGLPKAPYMNKSFHADENAAVWAVKQISFPKFNPRWFATGTAPYYQVYVVMKPLTLLGMADTDYWIYVIGRLLVWAHAMGCIALTFLLGRRLFDIATGRWAASILAVLPGFVINSHYFKPDVPVTAWILAALLAGYRAMEERSLLWVGLLGLLVGYSGSVKYSALPVVLAGLVFVWQRGAQAGRGKPWAVYVAGVIVGFLGGEPVPLLRPAYLLESLRWNAGIAARLTPVVVTRYPGWIDYPLHVMPLSLGPPMALLAGAALVWVVLSRHSNLLPIWGFLVPYFLLLGADHFRVVRYTVPLLPFVAIFVAAALLALARVPRATMAATALGLIVVVYSFVFSLTYVRAMSRPDPRIQAAMWVEAHVLKTQPIAVSTHHYLDVPQLQLLGYQQVEVDSDIARLQAAHAPYLLISEITVFAYLEAIDRFPKEKAFLQYIRDHYEEVAHFENSQRIWWIDSKKGRTLSQDWLFPNPRITILKRR